MKIKSKKRGIALCVCAITLACALGGIFRARTKNIVLELGMFAGSNWGVSNGDSYHTVDRAIAIFEHSHPGVRVHYFSGIRKNDYDEWLSQQILLGKTPDVFFVPDSHFTQFAEQGILKNLTGTVESDSDIKSWEYFPSAWNSAFLGGKQYALPYQADFMLMAVNLTLLNQRGLELPEQSWTWNDFYALAKETGMSGYSWQDAVFSNGVSLFNDDGSKAHFSDSRTVDAIRFVQKLSALPSERRYTADDFDSGRIAFMPMSYTQFCTYVSYPYKVYKDFNYEWGCLPMPAGISGGNVSRVSTLLIGIYAKTRYQKLSYELLKTLTHNICVQTDIYSMAQGASPLRIISASKSTRAVIDSYTRSGKEYNLSLVSEILDKGTVVPKFARYTQAMQAADSAITKIIDEKNDADTSLKVLQQNVQNILVK